MSEILMISQFQKPNNSYVLIHTDLLTSNILYLVVFDCALCIMAVYFQCIQYRPGSECHTTGT